MVVQDISIGAPEDAPGVIDCCPGGLSAPLDRESAERLARVMKAVADPTRLQLLALLQSSPDGRACACDLYEPLGLTQPTVSHHLRILTRAHLITREQRGTWAWFSVLPGALADLAQVLHPGDRLPPHPPSR